MAFCPNCGKRVGAKSTFCSGCGSKMTPVARASQVGVAQPRAVPARAGKVGRVNGLMKAGGAGFILLMVAGVLALIAIILQFAIGPMWLFSIIGFIFALITSIISAIAILLIALGAYGLKKQFNNVVALVAFIIGIIAFVMSIIGLLVGFFAMGIGALMALIATMVAGPFYAILAITFILIRNKTVKPVITLITAILLFIYTGMIMPATFVPILVFVTAPLAIVVGIFGALVMFKG